VGFCAARRIAHEVLATPRFRPGVSKPALSSDFPQRHFDPKFTGPETYVMLVQKILQKCFDGKIPPLDTPSLVGVMMAAFTPTTLAGQPEIVLHSFAAGLTEAVDALRQSENCAWKN